MSQMIRHKDVIGGQEISGSEQDQLVIQNRREWLHSRLQDGTTGVEVVESFTDLIDGVLIGRYRAAIREEGQKDVSAIRHCCLVAVGGYGRRELAPYSDIDVMILYQSGGSKVVSTLSQKVFHHLWDLGFQVGHSVRSISDCLKIAEDDLAVRTSLMESRFLGGDPSVFQEFRAKFARRFLGKRSKLFVQQKLEERKRDYAKFGETVFLLEPNVKKSKGGLRDLHLLQWVGMAKYEAMTLQELSNRGLLAHQDYLALLEAREFLWRVRCLMHFQAGRAQDILSFEEQVRLAAQYQFVDQPHILAVEQFMQQYFRHTTGIYDRCMRFLDRTTETSLWSRLCQWWPSPFIEGWFQISHNHLTVPTEKLLSVLDNPELLVRFFQVAQEQDLPIETQTLDELHHHLETMPYELFHTPAVSKIFRQILSSPRGLADTLESMHRARLLQKLIPAFARVRGLMQFNQYHKYTVDEHSILAVRQAERLLEDKGPLGTIYQDIHQKDLLHLALLLHDLGKGRPEDHSEAGRIIAVKTAGRLGLNTQETSILEFLVYKHLLMANIAFRRDLHDEKIILNFAREVKTVDVLKKLLILTAADIAAVGPDVMSKWKETLLLELYRQTLGEISGDRGELEDLEQRDKLVHAVAKILKSESRVEVETVKSEWGESSWVRKQLEQFSARYVSHTSPDRIAEHLVAIQGASLAKPIVKARFNAELNISEYMLIAHEKCKPGLFMNVTGVLAALGLEVLDAQIITRKDGYVVDTFFVSDPDYHGQPPPRRIERVSQTLVDVVTGEESVEKIVERGRRITFGKQFPTGRKPTEVQIDNEISDHYTVIDVFADNKQGLLFVIARAIFELGLSVHSARIGTRLDQVVDVFYVTNSAGKKVLNSDVCCGIQESIQKAADGFLDQPG
jgi:[protein-PII] uridylyltransferase